MKFRNDRGRYGIVSQLFHWIMGGLFVYVMYLGLTMEDLPKGAEKFEMMQMHKSLGIILGIMIIFRTIWTITNINPDYPSPTAKIKRIIHKLVVIALYGVMIGLPLSGYVMSYANGYEIKVFDWFVVPDYIGKNEEWAGMAHKAHGLLAHFTIGLLSLHILAAIYHIIFDKADSLKRMLPFFK